MFTNKMIFPLLLIVIFGFHDCQSISCYECKVETKDGKVEAGGEAACEKVKDNEAAKALAKPCADATHTHCSYITYKLKEGNVAFMSRQCTAKTGPGCIPADPKIEADPSAMECICDKDNCNDEPIAGSEPGPATPGTHKPGATTPASAGRVTISILLPPFLLCLLKAANHL